MQMHSDDAHTLLSTLTTEPALVLGSSAGALIGLDLLMRFPAQVPRLLFEATPIPLVIRHLALGTPSPGEDWLALNPEVGRQLGWTPTDEGLFRWIEASG